MSLSSLTHFFLSKMSHSEFVDNKVRSWEQSTTTTSSMKFNEVKSSDQNISICLYVGCLTFNL